MDKLDKHLDFLIKVFPNRGEECQETFMDLKREIRKTLYKLLQPKESLDDLMALMQDTESPEEQKKILTKIFHWYCPNPSFNKIVKNLSKGVPMRLDTQTIKKIKAFRRAPRKEMLEKWFKLVDRSEPEVIVHLLEGLRPFGRELEPLWSRIDFYANSHDKSIVKAALNLLSKMPTGVQKSIMTFSRYCQTEEMRLYALSAMQDVYDLPPRLLTGMLQPVVNEYRRLAATKKGAMNEMWQEFKLIRSIYRNNGITLSIPEIDLGRF